MIYTQPICIDCRHFDLNAVTCVAFPEGIPDKIFIGKNKHSKPLHGQGNDIVFEPIGETTKELLTETIFDFKPTKAELLAVVEIEEGIDLDSYFALLKQRAEWKSWPVEYLAVCDLQQLFFDRKDNAGFKKYTKILEEKFASIRTIRFNE